MAASGALTMNWREVFGQLQGIRLNAISTKEPWSWECEP